MEKLNAVFIGEGMSQSERLKKLNAIAISQMKLLTEDIQVQPHRSFEWWEALNKVSGHEYCG
jgi:hypothetical protein